MNCAPGVVVPTGLPTLRITSVPGATVPAAPTGSYATSDVTLPVATSPVAVVVTATNVPDRTCGCAGGQAAERGYHHSNDARALRRNGLGEPGSGFGAAQRAQ